MDNYSILFEFKGRKAKKGQREVRHGPRKAVGRDPTYISTA